MKSDNCVLFDHVVLNNYVVSYYISHIFTVPTITNLFKVYAHLIGEGLESISSKPQLLDPVDLA